MTAPNKTISRASSQARHRDQRDGRSRLVVDLRQAIKDTLARKHAVFEKITDSA